MSNFLSRLHCLVAGLLAMMSSGCGHVGMHVYKAGWEKEMTRQYAPIKQAAATEEARRAERFAAAGPGAFRPETRGLCETRRPA